MGLWSSIKNAVKKVVRAVKTVVRVVVKIVIGIVFRIINVLGSWLPITKKMRIQVFLLYESVGEFTQPVDSLADVEAAVAQAVATFKQRFNISLRRYGSTYVQEIKNPAPDAALNVGCDADAWLEEFGEAGDFFADNLAGWNAIPISLTFPISVFIVKSIAGKIGCSIPIADYVVLSPGGVDSDTTMAHELGHTGLLTHRSNMKNLMYPDHGRDTNVTGWQRFVVRTSRHCTFW